MSHTVMRRLREQKNMTQKELGELCGLYQGEISKAEGGQRVRRLELVAAHLGLDNADDLLLDWDEYRDRKREQEQRTAVAVA